MRNLTVVAIVTSLRAIAPILAAIDAIGHADTTIQAGERATTWENDHVGDGKGRCRGYILSL